MLVRITLIFNGDHQQLDDQTLMISYLQHCRILKRISDRIDTLGFTNRSAKNISASEAEVNGTAVPHARGTTCSKQIGH